MAQEIDAYMENDEGKSPEYEEIMTIVRKVDGHQSCRKSWKN